ncbi:hypothetical protein [Actinokineospora enzanensis]|uniref:hypothetical protein n=1 Tax=Actinokineospora enzanensis TaxID=155975 RepID=UPI0012EBE1D2|nr:hypothetical protein [Actinokineospora enzanensis]
MTSTASEPSARYQRRDSMPATSKNGTTPNSTGCWWNPSPASLPIDHPNPQTTSPTPPTSNPQPTRPPRLSGSHAPSGASLATIANAATNSTNSTGTTRTPAKPPESIAMNETLIPINIATAPTSPATPTRANSIQIPRRTGTTDSPVSTTWSLSHGKPL